MFDAGEADIAIRVPGVDEEVIIPAGVDPAVVLAIAAQADLACIPPGLDEMPPGPTLAAMLASIDVDRLTGHDRVVVLRARQRMVSHLQALVYRDMAAVADALAEDDDDDLAWAVEAAAAEIRVALRLTRRTADNELALAMSLRDRIPDAGDLLASGAIDGRRAWVIEMGTCHLDDDTARRVVERITPEAGRFTAGQLGARLRGLCIEADPEGAADRYRQAVEERRVVAEPTGDGTAHLFGTDLPPDRVAAAMNRINHLARTLRGGAEARTMDQLRADVFLDLLEGTTATGGGTVDIVVDLATLARLADSPGVLGGYGPVVADIARQVAESQVDAGWRYTLTDPETGLRLADGPVRRRPTPRQRRTAESRHRTCVFPGCRMPATGCDLDHRQPFAQGGPTVVGNLAPLCRHDHHLRHAAGWSYEQLPDGDVQWTSPLGHRHTTSGRPPPEPP